MQTATATHERESKKAVDEALVREHLAHIISSPQFSGSPKLSKFLAFVVDTALAGQGDQIKESLIAVEVYGRPPDYNPQIDSTVRVEASRLRTRLRQYYENGGRDQPLEIELPKGKYVPLFSERNLGVAAVVESCAVVDSCAEELQQIPQEPATPASGGSLRPALLLLILFVCSGLLYYVVRKPSTTAAAAGPPRNGRDTVNVDAKTMAQYLRAYELLRIPVLKDGVLTAIPQSVFDCVRLFEEVTRNNPGFSKGWVGLAEANEWLYELDKNRPPERLIAARASARRAIELDPSLPEAWTILTSILFFREWDIAGAEAASHRAIELNPRDRLAVQRYVDLLRIQGRFHEAASELARAASLQPSEPNLRNRKALMLLETGRLEEAMEEAAAAEGLNPSKQQRAYTMSLWIQGAAHQRQGRMDQAEATYRKAIDHQPHDTWSEPSLGHLLAVKGRKAEAMKILAELQRQQELGQPRHKAMAVVHMGLGHHEEAITSLERAFVERDTAVLFAGLDWRLAPLRSNPRFKALLGRVQRASAPPTRLLTPVNLALLR